MSQQQKRDDHRHRRNKVASHLTVRRSEEVFNDSDLFPFMVNQRLNRFDVQRSFPSIMLTTKGDPLRILVQDALAANGEPRPRRRPAKARLRTLFRRGIQSSRPCRPMSARAPMMARTVETTRNPGVSSAGSLVSAVESLEPPSPTTTSPNMFERMWGSQA